MYIAQQKVKILLYSSPQLHVKSKSHIYAILSGAIIALYENEQPLISHRYF